MAEIQQVHTVRLMWDCTNNRTETIFKPLDGDISHITLKPSSPIPILKHILYYMAVDQYATDSRLIIHRQSSDIPLTIDTPRIRRVLAMVIYQPTYRLTCWPTCCWVIHWPPYRSSVDQHIDRHVDWQSTNMAIKRQLILGRHIDQHIGRWCRPILSRGVHKLHKIPLKFMALA